MPKERRGFEQSRSHLGFPRLAMLQKPFRELADEIEAVHRQVSRNSQQEKG
jgi:hypothetical protein